MSSFFGIDFFRVVNEGLVDDWAQVYARVPFEEDVLVEKGALFGVLRIKGGKKLVNMGSDIFLWLDEYFNGVEEKGDLRGLVAGLFEMSKELQAAWVWVMMDADTGERNIKAVAMNGGKVVMVRDGVQVVLSDGKDRVVTGGLKVGDKLGLGVGGMIDRLQELDDRKLDEIASLLSEQLENETEQAVAGLLLEVKKGEKKQGVMSEELSLETEVIFNAKPSLPDDDQEMVSDDRVVGPDGLKKKIAEYWFRSFKKRKRIEVREEKRGKRGKVLWLGVVFLILLVVSVVGGVIRSNREKVKNDWQNELSTWQKREEEAKSLVQINPAGARKLLLEVQEEVAGAQDIWVGTKYEEEWLSYKLKLVESWTEVSGEKRIEPKLFLGLSLIRSGLMGDRIISLGKSVGVLDLNLGLMVKIVLEDKKAEVVASDKDNKWKSVGGSDGREVFLTKTGLSLFGGEGVEFDDTVVDPVEIEVFGSGAYVLDRGAGELWRFNISGNEIQDRRRWLSPEQEVGIDDLVDLDIDGDIWVLGKKGEVSKLRRGNKERFVLEGKPEGLVGDRMAVQTDGEFMAILDNQGSRVVIFNKESGEYLHQLIWGGFSGSKDIMYTEEERLLVLSEGKLYWVE